MNVNKSVIDKESENLDAKSVTLLQPSGKMSNCRVLVAAVKMIIMSDFVYKIILIIQKHVSVADKSL